MVKQKLRRRDENTTSSARRSNSFFCIFSPEVSRKEKKIPSEFVSNVLKEVPHKMVLDCASGGPWPVKVLETEKGVFLRDGWEEFVEHNLLKEHDFLLFSYDGATPSRLAVQIFEKSGIEMDYSTAFVSSSTLEEEEGSTSSGTVTVREDKVRAFVNRSKRYLFERRMKNYNVCRPFTLFVPKDFCERHFRPPRGAATETAVCLKNAEGKAWRVNCRSDGRKYVFAGGWRGFVEDNNLKIGNVCIFELVGEEMTLRVQIF